MAFTWESIRLDFEEIDAQHRALVDKFEMLSDAVQRGEDCAIISDMVVFLSEYTRFHFTTEDTLMQKHKYPEIEMHRLQHREFISNTKLYQTQLSEGGEAREVALRTIGDLTKWIINHIRKYDRSMIIYVKERMASKQEGGEEHEVGTQPADG